MGYALRIILKTYNPQDLRNCSFGSPSCEMGTLAKTHVLLTQTGKFVLQRAKNYKVCATQRHKLESLCYKETQTIKSDAQMSRLRKS